MGILALVAAALSVGYYYYYLRGGPRIVDATYYWLQAKTFASGHLTLPVLHPSAALRGRFLYFDAARERLSALFPPGYAAILSLGMLLHVPQLMGPCMAVCLRLSHGGTRTSRFRRLANRRCGGALERAVRRASLPHRRHAFARLRRAAVCDLALGALGTSYRDWAVAGLSAGWLLATRPVSAIALLFVIVVMLRPTSRRLWFTFGGGVTAGCCGLASV